MLRLVYTRVQPIRSIAVLPFRDLGGGTADSFFADGMTDAVTTDLAKLGVSKVISETSVAKFKDTKETVPQIARTLGVDAVVEGAVEEWKWMGSPAWSHDGIIAVANAHKDKVKLTFPTGRASQILTSSSTRASKAMRGERSIFSRAIRLMSVL